jgi:hypothetical protein
LILTHAGAVGSGFETLGGASLRKDGGRSASGADTSFSYSFVFVERLKDRLVEGNSAVALKDYATAMATHELGHHRAGLYDGCKWRWDPYTGQKVWDQVAGSHSDGDCVMASPVVIAYGSALIYSLCGSGGSITSNVLFCSKCKGTITNTSWREGR